MSKTVPCAIARLALVAAVLAVVGCGGGGGDGTPTPPQPPPPSLFTGGHGQTGFRGLTDPVITHETRWGQVTSDGAGNFGGTLSYNSDTFVDTVDLAHLYSIGIGRSLTFSNSIAPYAVGRISASGNLSALSWLYPGVNPGLILNLQQGINQTNANLSGTYRGCFLSFNPGINKPEGGMGTYAFPGDGTWTGSWHSNVDGLIFGPQSPPPGTVNVGSTGAMSFTYESGFDLRGQLLRGGAVFSVAGATVNGNNVFWHGFVREGSGMGNASLSGTYALVGIYYDVAVAVLDWVGVGGTLTADGAGGYTATYRKNEATFISTAVTETGTYSVSSSGHFSLTRPGGGVFEGGLSDDGTFGMAGGATSEGTGPGLFLIVR